MGNVSYLEPATIAELRAFTERLLRAGGDKEGLRPSLDEARAVALRVEHLLAGIESAVAQLAPLVISNSDMRDGQRLAARQQLARLLEMDLASEQRPPLVIRSDHARGAPKCPP